ncbi:MAG: hypothetical protein HC767_03885, partial [Akkermansiaceae bacterium]|nr:hypothetical protein [Akkermansiaceae bacterium]
MDSGAWFWRLYVCILACMLRTYITSMYGNAYRLPRCRYEDRSEMSLERQEEVKQALLALESAFDFHVPDVEEGPANKDLRFMCHLWEPLRVIHKPLMFAILMEASTAASSVLLSILGFRKYSTTTFTYWARNVKNPVSFKSSV